MQLYHIIARRERDGITEFPPALRLIDLIAVGVPDGETAVGIAVPATEILVGLPVHTVHCHRRSAGVDRKGGDRRRSHRIVDCHCRSGIVSQPLIVGHRQSHCISAGGIVGILRDGTRCRGSVSESPLIARNRSVRIARSAGIETHRQRCLASGRTGCERCHRRLVLGSCRSGIHNNSGNLRVFHRRLETDIQQVIRNTDRITEDDGFWSIRAGGGIDIKNTFHHNTLHQDVEYPLARSRSSGGSVHIVDLRKVQLHHIIAGGERDGITEFPPALRLIDLIAGRIADRQRGIIRIPAREVLIGQPVHSICSHRTPSRIDPYNFLALRRAGVDRQIHRKGHCRRILNRKSRIPCSILNHIQVNRYIESAPGSYYHG